MASCITPQWSNKYSPQARLTVTESSSTGGESTLSWKLEYVAHGYAANSNHRSYTVKINGAVVKEGTYAIDGISTTKTIATGTKTITKKTSSQSISFSVSFAFNITWSGEYGGTKSASGSITIPAKTSYTITYNANGGSGAPSNQTKWYGTALTLSSTKPSRTGHVFQGWATSSGGSVTYAAGASYTANSAATLYAVWKANTYKVTYNANGGSGAPAEQTKTYGKTLTLSSTIPTRKNYEFLGWSTSASATTATYSAGGNYTSNSAATLYAVWKLAYAKPKISDMNVVRCDADSKDSDEGTYASVTFSWKTTYDVTGITIEMISSSSLETITVTASGTSGSVSEILGGSLSTDISYTIRAVVTDSGGSGSASRTLSGTLFTVDCLAGGNGVAFGKPAELSGYADFGFNACFINGNKICGVDLAGNIKEAFQPQNENGNTVIGWSNYDRAEGNTNVYGHDVHFGISNTANPGTFRPYRRQGDSIAIEIHTSGYVTNSRTWVRFLVPFSCPIIGSPTVTITSNDGFILRQSNIAADQHGVYTHGSSASVCVIPSSYTAVVHMFQGVEITATFKDTTNAVNNAPVGIYWSGTITFA